jgi:hypothetical protein
MRSWFLMSSVDFLGVVIYVTHHFTNSVNIIIVLSAVSLWLCSPFVGPWPLFQFLNLYTVGRAPWTGDKPVARPLPTHRRTQTQNKRTQISMPRVGFEPTIPAFERTKTVHLLDCAAIVIGFSCLRVSRNVIHLRKHILALSPKQS